MPCYGGLPKNQQITLAVVDPNRKRQYKSSNYGKTAAILLGIISVHRFEIGKSFSVSPTTRLDPDETEEEYGTAKTTRSRPHSLH